MTSEPDILRATPRGSITTPKVGIPVLATIRWRDGGEQDVPATAMAWTAEAVEVVRQIDAVVAPYLRSTRVGAPDGAVPARLLIRLFLRELPERAS